MRILEKDLEDMIYNAYTQDGGRWRLAKRGLELQGYMLRQLPLQNGTIPDLVTFEHGKFDELQVQIIELKKGPIDFDTYKQAYGYLTYVRDLLKHLVFDNNAGLAASKTEYEIVLVGSSASDELCHLSYDLQFSHSPRGHRLSAYTYEFSAFEGLSFNKKEYTGFKDDAFIRDARVFDASRQSIADVFRAYIECIESNMDYNNTVGLRNMPAPF